MTLHRHGLRIGHRLRSRRPALLAAVVTSGLILGGLAAVAPPAAAATFTIWDSSAVPATPSDPDPNAVELGVKFRSDVAGQVTGVRFYKGTGNTGTHIGHLWSSTGTNLATVTFTGESASGWQQANFATPIAITAGTTYIVSYYAPVGRYSADTGYFSAQGVDNGVLHALRDGADGGNGVYRYGTGGGFPNSTFDSTNYWVDVVLDSTTTDSVPPTVTDRTPAPGATGISTSTAVSATLSEAVQAGTVRMALASPGGNITGTTAYDAGSRTATFTPAAALAATTTYTATVSGAADAAGNVMSTVTWSFTTGTTSPSGCPCTIWPTTTTPGVVDANDASAVELGVKFRSSTAGFITGVRFYKAAANTGTHTASLWTSTGTRLSTGTLAGESASGWQQLTLPAPVAVTANTTYVASYHTDAGHYSATNNGLATAITRGPLTALASGGTGGNGVYLYGGGGFPTNTYQASNYWVDVVFDTTAVDTTPPAVISRVPAANATGVATSSKVSATFGEPVTGSSVAIGLTGPDGTVAGTATYDSATFTASFTPTTALATSTGYTATVSGATDAAGNTMAPTSWSFSTAAPAPPPPDQGPGGPILVVRGTGSGASTFTSYTAEILRAEGLDEFAVTDLSAVTATVLNQYDVVILGSTPLTAAQVSMLSGWVTAGGNLITFRPDQQLAGLLGLTGSTATLANGYLRADTTAAPGAGITDQTIQFHGTADRYTLNGARSVATLYTNATTATTSPAVSLMNVGTSGGQAAAFGYDLPQSIIYTRQGNPAWAGQDRDGQAPIRSDDLYFGGSATDWVNLAKAAIPQADEQQRLLANLIGTMNLDRKPLPRFWYFPRSARAVVVATGDDHGNGGTAGRFSTYTANSPAGCVVDSWQCLRFTSYIYPETPLSNAQAAGYNSTGFEVGLHPQSGCGNFTPASLDAIYSSQLSSWRQKYTSLPAPTTSRFHCIVWSDWSSQATVGGRYGIRLDTNYYYWPGSWVADRPGFMTGSGMPMRFADTAGTMIDSYQAATQMTDESEQSYPFTPNTLLDNALGPLGYYGAFVTNMHTDDADTFEDDQLVASATAHGVPMVTARQLLTWIDGRNRSSFSGIGWSGNQLSFTVAVGAGADGLTGMVPTVGVAGTVLSGLTRAGSPVPFTRTTIKGVEYGLFQAAPGAYTATYGTAAVAAVTASTQGSSGGSGGDAGSVTVDVAGPAGSTAELRYGTSPDALDHRIDDATQGGRHRIKLTGLRPNTAYWYQARAKSPDGTVRTAPVQRVTVRAVDSTPPAIVSSAVDPLPDGTAAARWSTDETSDATLLIGRTPRSLTPYYESGSATSHIVVATQLEPGTRYYYRLRSVDPAGNSGLWPAASKDPASFVTPAAGVADRTAVGFRTGSSSPGVGVRPDGLGGVGLVPGTTRGRYRSRIMDAQQMVGWTRLTYRADLPAGSSMSFSVRTGSSLTPDSSWTRWAPVGPDGLVGTSSRYIQYRVDFSAPSAASVPVLREVGITHGGTRPVRHRES